VGAGPLAELQHAFGPLALSKETRDQLGREISPIYYVTDRLPPTLMIHGDRDEVVPIQQAEIFQEKARSVGAKSVELIVRHGKGHGWGDFWKSEADMVAFANWFDRHLMQQK
jgi:dipeptidyl aminopeptidase/acylaminoacyl peptidase